MSKNKFKGLSYEVVHNGDTIPTDPESVWFESAVCPQCSSGDKQEKNHRDGELTRTFICRNCNCVYRATVNGIKTKEKKEKHNPKNQNSFFNKIIRGLNKEIVTVEQFFMATAVISAFMVILSMFIELFDDGGLQQPISLQNNFDVLAISFLCMMLLSFFFLMTYEIVDAIIEDVKE